MRNNRHYYSDYYYQMWTRSPPYLIGILLGFLLHQTKNKKIFINKVHRWFAYLITILRLFYFSTWWVSVGRQQRLLDWLSFTDWFLTWTKNKFPKWIRSPAFLTAHLIDSPGLSQSVGSSLPAFTVTVDLSINSYRGDLSLHSVKSLTSFTSSTSITCLRTRTICANPFTTRTWITSSSISVSFLELIFSRSLFRWRSSPRFSTWRSSFSAVSFLPVNTI